MTEPSSGAASSFSAGLPFSAGLSFSAGLPFSAVVGQGEAKRALMLAATRPRLGGVLLRGDKGSAKTTLARGLAALLPGDAPFVEVPLGATEERVIGSIDLAGVLTEGELRFRPGLLAAANGGVLYIDEVNLLADHLVDALLDVAVSGRNRVERDGVSHVHEARFVLVASMNPEEGELRPQLLDRFGLAVDIAASAALDERVEAVQRQLDAERGATEADAKEYRQADEAARRRIATAQKASVRCDRAVIEVASRLALAVDAEGLRADLMLCRAAEARAALEGRDQVEVGDVRAVAGLVLTHRRRRQPFDPPGLEPDELDQAWDAANPPPTDPPTVDPSLADGDPNDSDPNDREPNDRDPDEDDQAEGSPGGVPPDQVDAPGAPRPTPIPLVPNARRAGDGGNGKFDVGAARRGRQIRDVAYGTEGSVGLDAFATAGAYARRRAGGEPAPPVDAIPGAAASRLELSDLRAVERAAPTGRLVVFVVDASSSMGVEHRMAATKAAVLDILADAYRRRGRVAVVTFRGEGAEVVLRPTGSVELAQARLAEVATGGTTPLAAGLDAAASIVSGATGDRGLAATVVVVTDGRATAGGDDPVAEAHQAMARLAGTGAQVVVLDTESGPTQLGLARELAVAVGAEHHRLDDLDRVTADLRRLP